MTKFIFVTGGVVSSLGKGLTSASIGMLLEARGLAVRMQGRAVLAIEFFVRAGDKADWRIVLLRQ